MAAKSGNWSVGNVGGVGAVQKHWLKQWSGAGWASSTPSRSSQPQVPADFQLDKDARYTGEVSKYYKHEGYGFIVLDKKGVVPNDKVFVYWKNIQSDDRFPSLLDSMKVEFGLMLKKESDGRRTLAAKTVTLPGGAMVAVQDMKDAKKDFVGGQLLRYSGKLKFFDPARGFGYITLDDGYALDAAVPKEICVETAEVNAGGKQPRFMEDTIVEFGIWKTLKGAYKAYNMTLPGGYPMTQEALEKRELTDSVTFSGVVMLYTWYQGWGFIRPDTDLPAHVQEKVFQMEEESRAKGKTVEFEKSLYFRRQDCEQGSKIDVNAKVTFNVYIDEKGAGAANIRVVA